MRTFDEMNRMFREMDRTFDQLRTTWMTEVAAPRFEAPASALEGDSSWHADDAAASFEKEGDAYVFVMDLPGFEKEEIDLTFDEGVLSIRAHTDVEEGSEGFRSVRSRRVSKQVAVPKAVIADEIAASYHNGVLEVRLPILEAEREDEGHRIDIE